MLEQFSEDLSVLLNLQLKLIIYLDLPEYVSWLIFSFCSQDLYR
jgi:hypothetical protein